MTQKDPKRHPTLLGEQIVRRIRDGGPLTVAEYMRVCLHDPVHGYYRTQKAIGREGDFITAPEISQVFGELIGLWCAIVWQQMGAPSMLNLIELGPGRGSLMRDALRAARAVPGFRDSLTVHLVETNAALAQEQRTTLSGETVPLHWHESGEECGNGAAAILIANEFLDTIPIDQWVYRGSNWHKRCVGIDDAQQLAFVSGDPDPAIRLTPGLNTSPRDGDIFEARSPGLTRFFERLAFCGSPFAALLIDYGHSSPVFGDTLQGVRGHRYEDPLSAPGETDLTAQIDFTTVGNAIKARGLAVDGPIAQAEFLGQLGIAERASRLMDANPEHAALIECAIARLMAPNGMGTRFKVIGMRSNGLPPLPGLMPADIGPTHN